MPRHCNRIAAKWQEKYPEFQSIDALSGALSALPIMLQRERRVNAVGPCGGAARAGLQARPEPGGAAGPFFGTASGFVVS